MAADGENADAKEGLARAKKEGGAATLAEKARLERAEQKKTGAVASVSAAPATPTAAAASAAHRAAAVSAAQARAHAELVERVHKQRRIALEKWKKSTGTEMKAPEVVRGGSVRVDVFGTLRGSCAKTGCKMWRRDVSSPLGQGCGWSDTRVLFCEECGEGKDEHEDCGPYECEDPPPPRGGPIKLEGVTGM